MPPRAAADRIPETIHLVRHAHAGDAERWEGPDELRPLSRKGRDQATRLGAFLVGAGVRPDRIITSPKVRAAQTADVLGAALGLVPTVDQRLAEGCGLDCLDAVLGDARAREPLLVGHDPDFSDLLSALTRAQGTTLRKGAIATLDVGRPLRAGAGALRWLIPPELLPATRDG
jgi:phosphohistidine phosphatase SixA